MKLKALPLATFCFVLLFLHNFARHICGYLCYLDNLTSLVFTVIKCFDWFLDLLNFNCYDNNVFFFYQNQHQDQKWSVGNVWKKSCMTKSYGKIWHVYEPDKPPNMYMNLIKPPNMYMNPSEPSLHKVCRRGMWRDHWLFVWWKSGKLEAMRDMS